jgi:hypothetical protein
MELKEILNFQNFLIVGLAGVAWTLFISKISNMCKDIENLEKTVMSHLLNGKVCDEKKT